MSEQQRFLVTLGSAPDVPVKVERIGEAGELTVVELPELLRLLTPGSATGTPQQIIINVYGSGVGSTPVVEQAAGQSKPRPVYYEETPKRPRNKPKNEE